MTRYESPLLVTVKGAVAGLVGTVVITLAMQRAPKLLATLGLMPAGSGSNPAQPTEKLAKEVSTGVFGKQMGQESAQTAGEAIHWGYGAMWGAVYGIVQSSIRLPHWLHGTIFGGLVATAASTLLPAMRLTPSPTEQPAIMNAMQLVYHLLYGWTTATVFHLLARK